ncbi:metal ABC transporter ATP-binding protein [Propionibacteriaceae bacterium Y2011]|uniref:metal ABC transporter ATP-binding protein n=1 Tax=Microlunatus sp. Y2014 TaxID=3418488 RepID=UPI003B4FCB07
MSVTPVLAAEDLRVVLGGGLPVLRGVTAEVLPGEAVALLGGNGSGKSTFIRAALGLVPIQHGRITLFGTPQPQFRAWHRIGYVPQRTSASLRGATVREMVMSGRLPLRKPFVPAGAADRDAVNRALVQVDLADRRSHEVANLSGGQQQRALIARALVSDPDLLMLDEPTAGVDLEHQQILADLIQQLITGGRSMLVVMHDVGPLSSVIDRSLTMRSGRIANVEPPPAEHSHDHHHPDDPTAEDEGLLPGRLIGDNHV